MPLTTEQRRANARRGMENRDRAMEEAREAQSHEPEEAPSGAVLLMRQTQQERLDAERVQQAAAAVDEVEELLMHEDPVEQTHLLDRGQGTDDRFTSVASRVTSPEARQANKNYVNVVRPPMRTLYRGRGTGEAVEVFHSDVSTLVEEGGLHVRCPDCRYLKPDHERAHLWARDRYGNPVPGIHATLSENACPGVEPLMWLPCRICGKKVYEEHTTAALVGQAGDDGFQFKLSDKDAPSPESRKERCEFRRNLHEVSFHRQQALQQFGLRYATYRADAVGMAGAA